MKKKKMQRIIRRAHRNFPSAAKALSALRSVESGVRGMPGFNRAWAGEHRGRMRSVRLLERAINAAETRLAEIIVRRELAIRRKRAQEKKQVQEAGA